MADPILAEEGRQCEVDEYDAYLYGAARLYAEQIVNYLSAELGGEKLAYRNGAQSFLASMIVRYWDGFLRPAQDREGRPHVGLVGGGDRMLDVSAHFLVCAVAALTEGRCDSHTGRCLRDFLTKALELWHQRYPGAVPRPIYGRLAFDGIESAAPDWSQRGQTVGLRASWV